MAKTSEERMTIYDVANEAGVSITTVSRFLNNPNNVKDSTGDRIAEAMDKLDYIPQGNTGTRAKRSVGRIGVLTPFFPMPSFVARLDGVIPPLREANYEVIIYTIENPEQLDEYLTSVPFTRRIDGLILISVHLTEDQHRILSASGLDIVMIESDDENYSRVLADDFRGGQTAADLFLKKNYLPCAYFGDINNNLSYSCHPSESRLIAFSERLKQGGYQIEDKFILESRTTVDEARRVFSELLAKGERPRAIFAMSDLHAIGVLKAAKDFDIKVPEELAILGFDDIEAADWMELSTITQHLLDSGRIAAGLLLEKMSGKVETIQKVNLQIGLIERSTT
ncbi:MAG: LacI family DNA-binding transcriptional regulator [Spirochaetales bacterium]|uniref:LacI family DNA-binding transcriptional regulator n=1 Tax=Candidatus Thalassospirochaeta sargassi TaxID=3119039 RepID=A0AAJ1IGL3_9SPIO|nr:LacI family DNA-binding transcriptional regulator [Spirochaetales bacterium]